MKFYGWVVIIFITLFAITMTLYFLFAHIKVENQVIEKAPVFSVNNNLDFSLYENRFNSIKFISEFSYGLIDYEFFVGIIDYNLLESIINIEPLTKDLYYDLKNLALSIDKNSNILEKEYTIFGIKLPYFQIKTNNFYIKLTPKVFLKDLSNTSKEDLIYLKTRYFIITKEEYKPYDFNKNILSGLRDFGGVIIDSSIINNYGVMPIINTLKENGVEIREDLKIIKFEKGA